MSMIMIFTVDIDKCTIKFQFIVVAYHRFCNIHVIIMSSNSNSHCYFFLTTNIHMVFNVFTLKFSGCTGTVLQHSLDFKKISRLLSRSGDILLWVCVRNITFVLRLRILLKNTQPIFSKAEM